MIEGMMPLMMERIKRGRLKEGDCCLQPLSQLLLFPLKFKLNERGNILLDC